MILKNNEADLNLVLKFQVENIDYTVFATANNLMFQGQTGGAFRPVLYIVEWWFRGAPCGFGAPGGFCFRGPPGFRGAPGIHDCSPGGCGG